MSAPELKSLLICDQVLQAVGSNKWYILGVYDRLIVDELPALGSIGVYVKMADVPEKFKAKFEVRDADDNTVSSVEAMVRAIEFMPGKRLSELGLQSAILIKELGLYHIVIFVDNQIVGMAPIAVVKEKP